MHKRLQVTLISMLFVLAGNAQNLTVESYTKARKILEQSAAAYGGLEKLRAIQNFSLQAEGREYHRNQSRRPFVTESTPRHYEVTFDLKNGRYRIFFERSGIGRDVVPTYDIFDGKERINANLLAKTRNSRAVQANWREQYTALFLPQFLLVNAFNRLAHLRYLGKVFNNNRRHEVVSYVTADGTQLSLYIDAATHLISKQVSLLTDALAGDAATEIIYNRYRRAGDFQVPADVITKIAGDTTARQNYKEVIFDKDLQEGFFRLDLELRPSPPPAAAEQIMQLGEQVYTVVASGYRVLFVNFKEGIWAMEAPAGEATAQAIKKMKETIPGKAIRYAAVSHFHADHSGGVRSYIAEGATIITTKGNLRYFQQMAKSRFTIAPDAQMLHPRPLSVEFVAGGKRSFTDGATTVELYNIGPTPHADELLIAYLPKEKIIVEADVYDGPFGDRSEMSAQLLKWIEQQKLVVEKIIPVHGTISSFQEFKDAVTASASSRKEGLIAPAGKH